ncbi:hypothetical protein [Sphingomonas canadensis]|nr:hypothetical protein [Sphingomonas canadensis]
MLRRRLAPMLPAMLLLAGGGCSDVPRRDTLPGCIGASLRGDDCPVIVGTWIVRDSAAPFPVQLYVFSGDGTMEQANPDAGNPRSSDSDGKGVWKAAGERVRGKWVELSADRETRRYTGRGEMSFDLKAEGDRFSGTATIRFYGPDDRPLGDPIATTLSGTRVTPP